MYKSVKRILDIIISAFLLPVVMLTIIIFGILIKLDDGGPIFYFDQRIGKDYKLFNMLKFRTMKVNAENILNPDGSTFNSKNDLRVTRIGYFLRKTSLDELPQIINVLKGEMSIVGPRPSMKIALDTFLDDEKDKMKVLPGITGYNQAYFRNNISNREKRLNDAWYSNNTSFTLDTKIIFKTIFTVLKKENLYTNEEEK